MKQAAIFKSNRSQAVRIPKEFAFPEGLDRVVVHREGKSIVLTPPDAVWDDLLAKLPCDDDFVAPDDAPPAELIEPL
jgi:antitoxin VapB